MFFSTDDKQPDKTEKAINGEDKGDSGIETQNSEGNADEEDTSGPKCYYDKTKSFFDNISCDNAARYLFFTGFLSVSSNHSVCCE